MVPFPRWSALGRSALVLGGALLVVALGSSAVWRGQALGHPPSPAGQDPADEEEREYQRRVMRIAFEENCLICHSEEMTTAQRLTPTQWAAEVEKMVNWGAPLPAEQKPDLIAYLAAEYPAEKPRPTPARLTPEQIEALSAQDA
ncbi:MAG: cytochrome c, partial [Isosphaeraceae bacterium]|nr:cytochrome c [Isosphaeraceae bacterium]